MPKSRIAKKGGSLSTAALPFGLWGLKILAEQGKLPGLGKKTMKKKGKKMTAGKKRRGGAGSQHAKVAPQHHQPRGIESLVGGGPSRSTTMTETLAQKVPPLGAKGGPNTTLGGGRRRRRNKHTKRRRR